jgi:hypothetical protein
MSTGMSLKVLDSPNEKRGRQGISRRCTLMRHKRASQRGVFFRKRLPVCGLQQMPRLLLKAGNPKRDARSPGDGKALPHGIPVRILAPAPSKRPRHSGQTLTGKKETGAPGTQAEVPEAFGFQNRCHPIERRPFADGPKAHSDPRMQPARGPCLRVQLEAGRKRPPYPLASSFRRAVKSSPRGLSEALALTEQRKDLFRQGHPLPRRRCIEAGERGGAKLAPQVFEARNLLVALVQKRLDPGTELRLLHRHAQEKLKGSGHLLPGLPEVLKLLNRIERLAA